MKKIINALLFTLLIVSWGYSQNAAPNVMVDMLPEIASKPADGFYPGPLRIPVNKLDLKGKELEGEELFAEQLQLDLDLSERLYDQLPSSEGGKILDIDIIRKLFPPFDDGFIGANLYSDSTHVPASEFLNFLFRDEIEKNAASKANPEIIFMAGGGGSGKGVTGKLFRNIFEKADIILDGTFANVSKAANRINFALEHGFNVSVIYVFRPIESAVKGIVERALHTGRSVPILVAASDHYDAQKTVLKLSQEFGNTINILVVDNSGVAGEAKIVNNIEDLLKQQDFNYASKDEVIMKAMLSYLDFIKNLSPAQMKQFSPELKDTFEKGMAQYSQKLIEKVPKDVNPKKEPSTELIELSPANKTEL